MSTATEFHDHLLEPEPEKKKGKLGKWRPKKWRPEYDRIVAYSVMGRANTWIAENLGFTPVHVSNILNQPEAIALATKLQMKLRDKIETNIPETLAYIAQKTAARLKEVMDDDDLFMKNPFQVIDRGLDVLKGLNHLKGGGNGGSDGSGQGMQIGTVIISNGQHSDILEGLQRVRDVKQIHSGPKKDGK